MQSEIPFKTLVEYVLDLLPDVEHNSIRQAIRKDQESAHIIIGIEKVIQNHSLKTVDEVLDWFDGRLFRLDKKMEVVFQEERAFDNLLNQVQSILDQSSGSVLDGLVQKQVQVFSGSSTDQSESNDIQHLLTGISLETLKRLYNSLNDEERLKTAVYLVNSRLKKIALLVKMPENSINRNVILKEINWFLLDQDQILDIRIRNAIKLIFNGESTSKG